MSPQAVSVPEPPVNLRLTLGAVVTVLLLAALGQTVITTALPIIVGDLGGLEHISWAITAYLLAATIGAPLCGKFGDMFGRKVVLQTGIVIFLVGSVLAALSSNMTMLVLARLVQGIGGGGLIVTVMAVVADVLPPRQRGRAQGLIGAAFGIATVIGPLLGGVIVERLSWPWLFMVNIPVGLLALGVIAIAFRGRPERVRRRIDYAGATTLAALLSSVVLYASLGGTVLPWGSPAALALLGIAALALAGFIWAERRAAEPIIPLFLFRNNAFLVSNAVGFAVGTVMFGAITFVPFYLQIVKGFTPTEAGLGLLPMMLGLIGMSIVAGTFMSRTGRYKMLPVAGMALSMIGSLLLSTMGPQTPFWHVALYMLAVGAGIGPAMAVGVAAIQNAVPKSVLGVGTASANMFRQTGGSIGVAVLGAIFGNRLAAEVGGGMGFDAQAVMALPEAAREMMVSGYAEALHPVFWATAFVALVGLLLGLLLREIPLSDRLEEPAAAE